MSNSTSSHQDATSQAEAPPRAAASSSSLTDAPPPAYTSTTSLPLPSYSSAANTTTTPTSNNNRSNSVNNNNNRTILPGPRQSLRTRPTPSITILLLGSPGVGKSTFLSALPHVRNGSLQKFSASSSSSSSSSLTSSPSSQQNISVPNPTSFNVSLFARPYAITIHRSTSQLFIDPFPTSIDFIIYAYDVSSRSSLYNARFYWRRRAIEFFEGRLDDVPAMLLGLKRDLRSDETEVVDDDDDDGGGGDGGRGGGREGGGRYNDTFSMTDSNTNTNTSDTKTDTTTTTRSTKTVDSKQETKQKRRYVSVMPEEGLEAARNMRCDRYAECSALTGELMWEVLEDITRTAAMTTTSVGGRTQGECLLM